MIWRIMGIWLVVVLSLAIRAKGQSYCATDTLRIACIGDSITDGARLINPSVDSYPGQLQKMFNEQPVRVKNFGISGATVLRYGHLNIWQALDSVQSFLPDIVIIMVGTNETVGAPLNHWKHASEFEQDYQSYLSELKGLPSSPEIFLVSPTDMNLDTPGLSEKRLDALTTRRPRLWNLRNRIQMIAKQEQVHFLDLTTKFKHKPSLFTKRDGVHPNARGYKKLAAEIYKWIYKDVRIMISNRKEG